MRRVSADRHQTHTPSNRNNDKNRSYFKRSIRRERYCKENCVLPKPDRSAINKLILNYPVLSPISCSQDKHWTAWATGILGTTSANDSNLLAVEWKPEWVRYDQLQTEIPWKARNPFQKQKVARQFFQTCQLELHIPKYGLSNKECMIIQGIWLPWTKKYNIPTLRAWLFNLHAMRRNKSCLALTLLIVPLQKMRSIFFHNTPNL